MKLNGNQKAALAVLGYVPTGYVIVAERCNTRAPYRVGVIYVDGAPLASIPAPPELGGNQPTKNRG